MKYLENNMNIKNTKPIFYALLIFMSSIFAIEAQGQTTIEFTSPAKQNVVLSELTSITGTATTTKGKIASVKIVIIKDETDEEWTCVKDGSCRWMTGPTGSWLATTLKGNTWSALSSNLPTGSNLPNGDYVVYALAFDSDNRGLGFQFRRKFTIRR